MRVGILGAGNMGRTHAAAYAYLKSSGQFPDVEIAAIVGRNEPRVKEVAAKFGVPGLTDPRQVLDDDSIDAIDVCYPTFMHREYVIAALERGKHVFCETPIALTLEDAEAMIKAARSHKRIFMVALLMRFIAQYTYIRDRVSSGELGQPLVAWAYRLSPPYWTSEQSHYGEPIEELMTFDFDYLNWLFGLPSVVLASGVAGPRGTIDHVFASLQFKKVQGLVEGSALMPESFPFSSGVRVLCEKGMLETSIRFEGGEVPKIVLTHYPSQGEAETLQIPGHDPYEEECAYFVRCVQGEADPALLSAEAARDALRVSLSARESLKRRERVTLT